MEDILQDVSNDHRSIYFGVQLKIMDCTQGIKLLGTSFKENELKIILADMVNHYFMLETIFEQAKIPHIYHLIRSLVVNFNSITAILLDKLGKAEQKEANLMQMINNRQEQSNIAAKTEELVVGNGSLLKQIRKNRLGGIHLFNQNYCRYIQDQKILDQIRVEKERRLQRKRLDLLRQSILQQLSHKTDVEQTPANNDDIASYIIQAKDKSSMLNYVSYEPELQEILEFFQKSQSEANQFLIKKMKNISDQDANFSFADLQRDIMLKKSQLRRQVVQKMSNFTEKYRTKQKQIQEYITEKENIFKQLQERHFHKCDKAVETELNFEQFMQNHQNQVKDLEQRCRSLENISKEHFSSNHISQNDLKKQLAGKETEIEKLNKKTIELEQSIESLKLLLRDEKIKKITSSRDIIFEKSLKSIPDAKPHQEKERKFVRPVNQVNTEIFSIAHDGDLPQANENMRRTDIDSGHWRKKQNTNMATFLSFNDVSKDRSGHQSLKPERKILLKYQAAKKGVDQEGEAKSSYSILTEKQVMQTPSQTQVQRQKQQKKGSNQQKIMQQKYKQLPSINQHSNSLCKKPSLRQEIKTPKKSARFIQVEEKKKSAKLITQKSPTSQKHLTIPASLKKIRFQQNPSRKQIKLPTQKEIKEDVISTKSQEKKELPSKSNKIQTIKKSQTFKKGNKSAENQQIQQSIRKLQEECQIEKKDEPLYDMSDVTEEDDDWTQKPSLAVSKASSIKSIGDKEVQMIVKLRRQLKKIQKVRNLSYRHLYDLRILPQKQTSQRSQPKSGREAYTKVQENEAHQHEGKNHHKLISLFDGLFKHEGSINKSKVDKLRTWRKMLINNIKSDNIAQQQIDQISAMISGSQLAKKNVSIYENAVTSIASISANIRNSLPQIHQITNMPLKTKPLKRHHAKPKQQQVILPDCRQPKGDVIAQVQQQIENLIKHESLQANFSQKFNHLHRHCEEGPLCSHITKYFDTIMRQLEFNKKKQRKSIALPVQLIGNRSKIEEEALKIAKNQQNKSLIINQNQKKGFARKNYSLTKHRYSQDILLPIINDKKSMNADTKKNSSFKNFT